MARVNNIPAPADVMLAQYSIPFSVALSVYRDPRDPRSFDESAVRDPDIRALAQRVAISVAEGQASGDDHPQGRPRAYAPRHRFPRNARTSARSGQPSRKV